MPTTRTFHRGLARIVGATALLGSLVAATPTGGTAHAGSPVVDREPVSSMADGSTIGTSTLHRSDRGLRGVVRTSDLEIRHAYTVWAVVFDNPEACDGPCDGGDLGNPEVDASSTWFAGKIARGGRTTFVGNLPTGDALRNPYGAEIHFIVRTHGPAIDGIVDEQLSTLNGGCPPNICANVQMSIHGR